MTARRKARKRALDLLYEADIRQTSAADLVDERLTATDDYAVVLVEGVVEHQQRIDEILNTHSQDWPVDRMPAVDRTILRIAAFEVLWNDDVPDSVAIDEAVTMAAELSTDDSAVFVNGVLSGVVQAKPRMIL